MEFQMLFCENNNTPEDPDRLRDFMGPHAVEQAIGQAISVCWMILPKEKKTIEGLEAEIRRVVERALKNLREDGQAFGILPGGDQPS
jgi:hypothetical protein